MTIKVGDRVPDAILARMGENGAEAVPLASKLAGRKVVIFGLPGAFTPTCHSAHLPSFLRVQKELEALGVDEIICVSVNDAHVMKEWGRVTGATDAGITLLADGNGAFARAIGMVFDAPAAGMYGRSKRYSMLVEDGVVTIFNPEIERGCSISGGETMLDQVAAASRSISAAS